MWTVAMWWFRFWGKPWVEGGFGFGNSVGWGCTWGCCAGGERTGRERKQSEIGMEGEGSGSRWGCEEAGLGY